MDVVLRGRGAGMALRGPGGHGAVRVGRAWRRAGVTLRARWEDVAPCASGGYGCEAHGPRGACALGLGIILVCKFDLWGNAHVF